MDNLPFPEPYSYIPRPAHRPKPMKVLALGLSRTGTMSLYTALKKLNYNCYHMSECCLDAKNDSLKLWHEAIDAKFKNRGRKYAGKDFDKMLWRYDAVTDIPCILFVDELMDAYPDAKILVTNRDVKPWLASIENSFFEILSWQRWKFLEILDWEFTRHYMPILKASLAHWTGGNWTNKSQLPRGFEKHYDHVRKAAAARGREVLEYRVQDGWRPLCRFLEKEVPSEPFPRVNEGDFVIKLHHIIFQGRLIMSTLNLLKYIVPVAIAILAYWIYSAKT